MNRLAMSAVVLATVLGVSACGGSGSSDSITNTSTQNTSNESNETATSIDTSADISTANTTSTRPSTDSASLRSYPVAFQKQNTYYLAANHDNVMKLWTTSNNVLSEIVSGHNSWITDIAMSQNHQTIATADRNGNIRFWNASDRAFQGSIATGHAIYSIAFSEDSSQLLSAGAEKKISLWNVADGSSAKSFDGHVGTVYGVVFHPDGGQFVSAGADGDIRVWGIESGQTEKLISLPHNAAIYALSFSPDGNRLVSAGEKGQLMVWDTSTWTSTETLSEHTEAVYALDYSADGRWLMSGGKGKEIKVWDMSASEKIRSRNSTRTLARHDDVIHDVAFSPAGDRVLSSSDDNNVILWDRDSGNVVASHTLSGTTLPGAFVRPDPVATSKDLSKLAFKGMKPIFDIRQLLDQPSAFAPFLASSFAVYDADGKVSQTGVTCPDSGSYGFVFTDTDSPINKKYDSAGDKLDITVDQCTSQDLKTHGNYSLTLNSVSTTGNETTVTDLLFNQLVMVVSSDQNTFTGAAQTTDVDDTQKTQVTVTSSNLNVTEANNNTIGFTDLDAVLENLYGTTGEKVMRYNASFSLTGSDAGNYQITTIDDFKLAEFEAYPYAGSLKIKALSGINSGITSTAIVVDEKTVRVETDNTGDGVADSTVTYNWSDLSLEFNPQE